MKSMWKQIRENANLTQSEFGEKIGKSKFMVCQYERGHRKMPDWLQIEYLKLRNNEEDKKIIKFLEERNDRKC
jgi:DNA-binding transcriptional regulator YiaG